MSNEINPPGGAGPDGVKPHGGYVQINEQGENYFSGVPRSQPQRPNSSNIVGSNSARKPTVKTQEPPMAVREESHPELSESLDQPDQN